jgi:DNA invertase Pin-like site-specific DNA recombinase
MLQMMGAFAEFERNLIRERQREGIAQAQKKGVKIGRSRVLQDHQIEEIRCRVALGAIKAELAKEYEISRPTLYAALAAE